VNKNSYIPQITSTDTYYTDPVKPVEQRTAAPDCNWFKNTFRISGCPIEKDPLGGIVRDLDDPVKLSFWSPSTWTAPKTGVQITPYTSDSSEVVLSEEDSLKQAKEKNKAQRQILVALFVGLLIVLITYLIMSYAKKR